MHYLAPSSQIKDKYNYKAQALGSKSNGDPSEYQNIDIYHKNQKYQTNKMNDQLYTFEKTRKDINSEIPNHQYPSPFDYKNHKQSNNFDNNQMVKSQIQEFQINLTDRRKKRKLTHEGYIQIPDYQKMPLSHPQNSNYLKSFYPLQKQLKNKRKQEQPIYQQKHRYDYSYREKSHSHQKDEKQYQSDKKEKINNLEQTSDSKNYKYMYQKHQTPKSNHDHQNNHNSNQRLKQSSRQRQKQMLRFTLKDGRYLYRFQIKKQLGQGSFGKVFLVKELKTNCLFAMKVLPKRKIRQERTEQNIVRELTIQSYLDHPNIIKLYKSFNDQDNIYLIMEYMKQCLYNIKQNVKKFSEEKTSRIIEQLIKAIMYLHTQKIIHRDLKLENIMISNKVVKIGDFGCAVYTTNMRRTKIGSPAYFSPQILKQSPYDYKVDIWSLGIITFELIFGQTPYDKDIHKIENQKKKMQLSNLKFPRDTYITDDGKDFILRLLQKDPLKRMSLQEALQHNFITKNKDSDELN